MASLAATFGRGAMTNGWVDIKNADVVLCMGGNPAENHPCGFKWAIEAKKTRNAKIVAVDPRFTRTAAVADLYSPIRPAPTSRTCSASSGTRIANNRFHEEYVKLHTNAPLLINAEVRVQRRPVLRLRRSRRQPTSETAWAYQLDPKTGYAKTDPTLQDPHCVFQLLKKHVDRYTPEMVERICGTPKETFLKVAEVVTSTGNAAARAARSCTRSAGRSIRSACR